MAELLTSAQMRAIEGAAIASGAVTGLELMERAGRGVVEAIFETWPDLQIVPHRAVILCGPGNNGGDGFVIARLLRDWGWRVETYLYGDPDKLPPDARANYLRWCERGPVERIGSGEDALPRGADLFVDAAFGTGLTRATPPEVSAFLASANHSDLAGLQVAVDMPSGLCSDSGRPLLADEDDTVDPVVSGQVGAPDLVVTFHRMKLGHVLGEAYRLVPRVVIKDIGLDGPLPSETQTVVARVATGGAGDFRKGAGAHKYAHGHAVVLSGPQGRSGAARLAARAALRVGAGLVTVGAPPSAMDECASQLTAVMLRQVRDAMALDELLQDQRLNALCLGPGMGVCRDTREMVEVALASGRASVLDADALTVFADDPEALFGMLHGNCVLTPHAGEFARLFPDLAEKLAGAAVQGPAWSKVDAAREAAARAGCVVLFKGVDTVIAAPDGGCRVNAATGDRAAPWLATAGSGDVLAGLITGLLARGKMAPDAAALAAWLHVECALEFGPGLIAEDLPEMLPQVFRRLGV
ncbi:NAD(P)H-hydrate dehydratase [Actibacterium sp. XHP0104]|uniref:NAD(P)H-hydrate dehydratase n=1 Tax=Actibacterium sp. XHP0104 TaxID=2984335 RepID=UPI0021E6ED21|nr:NAD(P)H-hydrate dehydratase [Actibacterium sp. XHP0104]MCV2880927.1 NAD(P)H-hydrate dehydratase [Actibacterium sp. XHP0104]